MCKEGKSIDTTTNITSIQANETILVDNNIVHRMDI